MADYGDYCQALQAAIKDVHRLKRLAKIRPTTSAVEEFRSTAAHLRRWRYALQDRAPVAEWEQFRGRQEKPPASLSGMRKASWHELAHAIVGRASMLLRRLAGDRSSQGDVKANWSKIRKALQAIPDFDRDEFVVMLQDEAARRRLADDVSGGVGNSKLVYSRGKGLYEQGNDSCRLAGQESAVLDALVTLRSATKDQLVRESLVADAPRILKQIKSKYAMLTDSITLPGGKARGGYRTTIIPPGDV